MLEFLPQGNINVRKFNNELSSGAPISIAIPEQSNSLGLVLIPDVFGMRSLTDETIKQIASNGITVIAIDEFFRMANEDKKLDEISREEKLSRMSELNDIEECADIIACAQLLRQQHGCTTVGLIGFCIGGMYAFKCAGSGVFDSVVSCYGMITMPNDWAQQGQKDAIDYLQNDACSKVLAIVGGEDFGFAKDDDVDLLRITLSNEHHKNIGSRLEIFNEAGHAFMHDPNREEYRSDDAKAAWKFAFDFLFENKV